MHASTLYCRQTRSENSDLEKERRRAKRILEHILSVCSIAAHFCLHTEVQLTKQNTGLGGANAMGRECLHMADDWCAMLEVSLAVVTTSEYLALRRNFSSGSAYQSVNGCFTFSALSVSCHSLVLLCITWESRTVLY
jgi:exoribonuclease II